MVSCEELGTIASSCRFLICLLDLDSWFLVALVCDLAFPEKWALALPIWRAVSKHYVQIPLFLLWNPQGRTHGVLAVKEDR